ncbi:unnamed protein product [Caenorhabditis angaria]|uniref:Gustatory receptor n=1 Tax=Caenorhabditis angaria TaxID=860376 RepID=A0A9P1IWI7_9PELO|nr:unnamed protein product [Caenorhabditis angaria]
MERLQLEELVDIEKKSAKHQIFGPFLKFIKLTGLDCTALKKYRDGKGNRCIGYLSHIFAIVVIFAMFFRMTKYMAVDGKVLSFAWSEANVFGFMSLHAIVCTFCLYGWTKNGFISNFLKNFEEVKRLRLSISDTVDDYSGTHKKCFIFPIPLFAVLMVSAIFNAVYNKYTHGGVEVEVYLYIVMPILMFLTWMVVSLTLIIYNLVHSALNREMEFFNEELQKAADEKLLLDRQQFTAFSHRQTEILKLVKSSNESLGSYAKFAPLFGFFSLISAIFNCSYLETLPGVYSLCMFGFVVCIIAIIILSLKPPTALQDHLTATSKILILNEDIETTADAHIYQIYRIMVDRSLNYDTKMYLLNGFPITTVNFNIAMFIVPNLGPCLMLLRKLLEMNNQVVTVAQ